MYRQDAARRVDVHKIVDGGTLTVHRTLNTRHPFFNTVPMRTTTYLPIRSYGCRG